MKEFVEAIRNCNPNVENRALIVIEGPHIGEEAVLSNHEFAYVSDEAGLLKKHADVVLGWNKNGVFDLDGERVYSELLGSQKKMVICGAGHVSIPIIKIGKMIGMHVTVIEDRPMFAENGRKAGADVVICDDFVKGLDQVEGDTDTYYVVVTRGHQFDSPCLEAICKKPYAYIGMMGSKRRVKLAMKELAETGTDEKVLADVHSPIGLEIGSETPEEIAISIIAEIIQVKNQRKNIVFPDELMTAIVGGGHVDPVNERMVLCTIVDKKGSAPRNPGSRMIITETGRCIGTIGGGCVEAKVIGDAREMLLDENPKPQLLHADLTADEYQEEGEVCGGIVDVFMEEV